jgi:hypothetical protein
MLEQLVLEGYSWQEVAMAERTVTLETLRGQPFEEILRDVAAQQQALTVLLPDGQEVIIEPKVCLKPLPVLEGYVPKGWKDAMYARG